MGYAGGINLLHLAHIRAGAGYALIAHGSGSPQNDLMTYYPP
jgi:hypothetical protein